MLLIKLSRGFRRQRDEMSLQLHKFVAQTNQVKIWLQTRCEQMDARRDRAYLSRSSSDARLETWKFSHNGEPWSADLV